MEYSRITLAFAAGTTLLLQSCASPGFDVPKNKHGPTAYNVVARVTCELVELIEDHANPEDDYRYKPQLLAGNYKVAATMTLDVADNGELAPALTYTATKMFGLDAGFKLSKTRTNEFSKDLLFSMRDLHTQWKYNHHIADCPEHNTLLAGDLGIRTLVDLGFSTPNGDTSTEHPAFGGYVSFAVVQNVNAFGPTWSLTHFKESKGFAELGRTNTDKLTFGFAQQLPPAGKKAAGKTGGKATNAEDERDKVKLNSLDSLLTKLNSAM